MTSGPVVIYADCLANRGGTGVYTRRLLRGLSSIGAEGVLAAVGGAILAPSRAALAEPDATGWRKTFREHHSLRKLASSVSPALVHLPAFSGTPPHAVPYVMTLHDLAFLRNPSWFPRVRSLYYRLSFTRLAARASLLIVDSDFTASEAVKLMNIPDDRIRRVYLSTENFGSDPMQFASVFDISEPYIISVGTVEPRKNVSVLLDAWELIRIHNPDMKLVIAGRWGWGSSALKHRLSNTDGVVWTGALQDDILSSAVSGARLLVYPSLYEGFGLPPLEAASAGVSSVVTPAGSLSEIYSGIAKVARSFSAEDIASAVQEALLEDTDVSSLREFASAFTGSEMARNVLEVYRELTH